MILGLGCAFGAALAYGIASILESVGIRRQPGREAPSLVLSPVYYVGLGLDGVGFVAVVIALQILPLFLVQAIVAASVAVTAVIAAIRGARMGRGGWIALLLTGIGLVLLGLSAAAEDVSPIAAIWRWVLLLLVVPIASILLIATKVAAASKAVMCAVGAGLGFSIVAIASRGLDFPDPFWRIVLDPAAWAVLTAGGIAVCLLTLALEVGSVTAVCAITFSIETVIPAVVGLAALGDSIRSGFWPVAAVGFTLAVVGSIVLAKFAEKPTAALSEPQIQRPTPIAGKKT